MGTDSPNKNPLSDLDGFLLPELPTMLMDFLKSRFVWPSVRCAMEGGGFSVATSVLKNALPREVQIASTLMFFRGERAQTILF